MLPSEWDIKPLAAIARITSGGTPARAQSAYWHGNIPWIRTTEVQNCYIFSTDVQEFITEEGLRKSSAKLVPENTILLAMIGQGKTRGQVALLKIQAATNQNCAAIILNRDQDAEFHFNFLLSQYENIRSLSNSAGQSNLSGTLVKSIKVPIPPISEQKKIARILSIWDQVIDTTEKLINNSKSQKQALMQQLLTGKKRFPGFNDDWQEYRLGQVFTERTETNRLDLRLLSITGEQGVIYRDDVGRKDTSSEDKSNYKRLCPGDIGYNTMRMWQGVSALSDKEGIVSPAYTILIPGKTAHPEFMSYFFKLPKTIHSFYRFSQGLVSDTWNLKYTHFKQIKVTIPGFKEQDKIAGVLKTADLEIANLQAQLEKLKEEKQALMQQLLTGKRRVKV